MAKDKAAEFTPGLLEHTVMRSNISYALERQNRRPPEVIAELASKASGNHVFPEFTPNLGRLDDRGLDTKPGLLDRA